MRRNISKYLEMFPVHNSWDSELMPNAMSLRTERLPYLLPQCDYRLSCEREAGLNNLDSDEVNDLSMGMRRRCFKSSSPWNSSCGVFGGAMMCDVDLEERVEWPRSPSSAEFLLIGVPYESTVVLDSFSSRRRTSKETTRKGRPGLSCTRSASR